MKKQSAHAFTLVELSIVLVVLGLLVGGVLSGQSLIRAAELRSITKEMTQFQTAVFTFRDKYRALPGDFARATRYWTPANPAPATCINGSDLDKTCNGDGNGIIGGNPTAGYNNAASENTRFWQHLQLAGLIKGQYTGYYLYQGGPITFIAGTNVPTSAYPLGGWDIWYYGPFGATLLPTTDYGHIFEFGAGLSSDKGWGTHHKYDGPLIPAEDAHNIDMKMDDGRPDSGNVLTYRFNGGFSYTQTCVSATDSGSYQLDSTVKQGCQLFFKGGF